MIQGTAVTKCWDRKRSISNDLLSAIRVAYVKGGNSAAIVVIAPKFGTMSNTNATVPKAMTNVMIEA